MTVTKSVRLSEQELREIRTVVSPMPGATEAGALKHLLMLGLEAKKRELAVALYTRQGLSTGEIAERLNMSRLDVLHALEEARVRVLDIDPQDFAADLARHDVHATE